MNYAIGVVALLVAQCAPAFPRTLGDTPLTTEDEPHSVHVTSDEPILPIIARHRRHSAAGREERHKVKVEPDGSLWARLPPSERLVEIVPIEHSTDGGTGRALAYILPSAGDTAGRKQNRAPGLVVGDVVPDSSEQLTSSYDTWESEPSESSGSENHATGEDIARSGHQQHSHHATGVKIEHFPKENIAYVDDDNADSEDKIHNKLNEIVSYFKEHKEADLNSLIHDVLPSDDLDPEFHVHYIIHKNHRPKDDRGSEEGNSLDDGNNIIHTKYKPKENDIKQKEINVFPKRPAIHHHDTKDELEQYHHHHHTTSLSDATGHPNVHSIHSSHKNNEYDIDPVHKTIPRNDELLLGETKSTIVDELSNYASRPENLELSAADKNVVSIESTEQLHDSLQEGGVEAGPDQRFDTFSEIDKSPETDINYLTHVSNVHNSDPSDYSHNNLDESSNEHYSDSFDDDDISDEEADRNQSIADGASTGESLESEDSLQPRDVAETVMYQVDRGDVSQAAAGSEREDGSQVSTGGAGGSASGGHSSTQSARPPSHFTFSDCLKKKKECTDTCETHKTYTLTFSFSR